MEKGIREVLDMAQQGENKKPLTLEDLTAGLLYYYGVIEWDALYRQLRDCFHIEIDEKKAWKYLQGQFQSNPSLPFRCQNRLLIFNTAKNPKNILKEQNNHPAILWRPVTEAEVRLLVQGQDEKLWGDSEQRLLSWIQTHKNIGKKAAV